MLLSFFLDRFLSLVGSLRKYVSLSIFLSLLIARFASFSAHVFLFFLHICLSCLLNLFFLFDTCFCRSAFVSELFCSCYLSKKHMYLFAHFFFLSISVLALPFLRLYFFFSFFNYLHISVCMSYMLDFFLAFFLSVVLSFFSTSFHMYVFLSFFLSFFLSVFMFSFVSPLMYIFRLF